MKVVAGLNIIKEVYVIQTIEDFKNLPENVDKTWAIKELQDFLEWIEVFNDGESHTDNDFGKNTKLWYSYIHEKLNKCNFINGEPKENTWEKRPKARFWFCIYCTHIVTHNRTEKEIKYSMIEKIKSAINLIINF